MIIAAGGASGSVNRLLGPGSVRHMSVTTAMQRLTAAHRDTRWDKTKVARGAGKSQLTGHFRWWWQVLGSNQRRRSRRFLQTARYVGSFEAAPTRKLPSITSRPARETAGRGGDGLRGAPLGAPNDQQRKSCADQDRCTEDGRAVPSVSHAPSAWAP